MEGNDGSVGKEGKEGIFVGFVGSGLCFRVLRGLRRLPARVSVVPGKSECVTSTFVTEACVGLWLCSAL